MSLMLLLHFMDQCTLTVQMFLCRLGICCECFDELELGSLEFVFNLVIIIDYHLASLCQNLIDMVNILIAEL